MIRKILWALIPILLLILFIFLLAQGLKRDQTQMPSALLEKPLPDFNLTDLYDEKIHYNKNVLLGQMALVNIWASWCPPCAAEHDVIVEIAQTGMPVYGLNYQDLRGQAQLWLKERGNPYKTVLFDERGSVGIDWGVIGVPETFLIDAQGIVRYRHIGELTVDVWNDRFMPLIHELNPPQAITPYEFTDTHAQARFYELTGQLRCMVCQNQTLLDSDAPLAKNLRDQVYEKVVAGESNDQIVEYLTQRYGDFILYQPPVNKNTWLLWFGPILLLLLAGIVLIFVIRRAHRLNQGEK